MILQQSLVMQQTYDLNDLSHRALGAELNVSTNLLVLNRLSTIPKYRVQILVYVIQRFLRRLLPTLTLVAGRRVDERVLNPIRQTLILLAGEFFNPLKRVGRTFEFDGGRGVLAVR